MQLVYFLRIEESSEIKVHYKLFRFVLRTLKEFGFGNVTMEDIILNDAVSLTIMIESLAKLGPITNLHNITSIAILNSLWTLVAGSKYIGKLNFVNYARLIARLNQNNIKIPLLIDSTWKIQN